MSQITTNCATNESVQWELLQGEVRTSTEETFKVSQSSRQVETTSTRSAVIDDTRQRQYRQDHEDGHWYCWWNRRQEIDKFGPVERVQERHTLLVTYRQPSCNHPLRNPNQIAFDCKVKNCIHGSAVTQRECRPRESEKRRTIDSLSTFWRFPKNLKIQHFFSPCLRVVSKQEEHKVTRARHLPFHSGRFNPEQGHRQLRGTTRVWNGKETLLNYTSLFRIGTLHQVYGRTTPSFHQYLDDRSAYQAVTTRSTSAHQILYPKEPLWIKKTLPETSATTTPSANKGRTSLRSASTRHQVSTTSAQSLQRALYRQPSQDSESSITEAVKNISSTRTCIWDTTRCILTNIL